MKKYSYRESKDIIGIGLPRTGTSSLSSALNVLGYEGRHSCIIFGDSDSLASKDKSYLIDNSSFKKLNELLLLNPNKKYILTTREDSSWSKSIKNFSLEIDSLVLPSDYEVSTTHLFRLLNRSENLLVINVFDNTSDQNWQSLCEFLDEPIPNEDFPRVKRTKDISG